MLREIGAPKSPWVVGMAAIAACALGFALTYSLARQRGGSPEPPSASLSLPGSEREQDGLVGPVNRVRTETAKLFVKSGRLSEGPRELLESTAYDLKGNRVDNNYYLVNGNAQVGREEYAYDDKGNIGELTVRDNDNAILGKEVYTYQYDALGNWTRMVTARIVYEKDKLVQQPTEATYRNITYYFDQSVAEVTGPTPPRSDAPEAPPEVQEKISSLRGALDQWIAATNARNADKLMDFYDPKIGTYYRARNVSREFVRADKSRLFQRAEFLDVRAGTPEINVNPADGTAIMYFRKQYVMTGNGRERSGEVLQQLRWRRSGEQWKIVGERDAQVIR